jgi:hypothetical protein
VKAAVALAKKTLGGDAKLGDPDAHFTSMPPRPQMPGQPAEEAVSGWQVSFPVLADATADTGGRGHAPSEALSTSVAPTGSPPPPPQPPQPPQADRPHDQPPPLPPAAPAAAPRPQAGTGGGSAARTIAVFVAVDGSARLL